MKRAALLLLPVAVLTIAATRDRGPGVPGVRTATGYSYAVDGFDTVTLGGAETVDVRVGSGFSVRAEGPSAAFANFRVERENNALIISRRYEGDYGDDRQRDLERQIKVYVTLPRIDGATLGGSGTLAVDRIRTDRFKATLGGSGSLVLGEMAVDHADVSIGGSGVVTAAGHARGLEVSIGGSGRLAGAALHADSARVSMAGSGSVRAAVNGPATVTVVGSGDVDLGRGARCSTTRMGHGTVRCGG